MATRGWEHVTPNDVRHRRGATTLPQVRSKYRNVRTVIDGEKFDSKREAAYWLGLQARERAGEIQGLERQVPFPLYAPDEQNGVTARVQVSTYVADFVYHEGFDRHVVDAKGKRTALYQLKKKWLELQDGIVIEEV